MTDSIHVRLDTLTGAPGSSAVAAACAPSIASRPVHSDPAAPGFYIETFGCQMNEHDTEKVAGLLFGRGYRQVDSPNDARLVFYNTCSIREKAAQKLYSRLGLFNPKNDLLDPTGKIIGVLGCVAQQEGERIFDRAPWVGLVCGSASYRELPQMLSRLESGERRVTGLDTDTDETFETEFTRRDHPFRAYITIIEGCDKACSYCVVPRTRGPERSRASESVLREARELAALGYSEIMLLGQTVNSYKDPSSREGARGLNFAQLLAAVAATPGIHRVRFMTSHPRDLSPEMIEVMASVPTVCDHLHLPAQSGSTRILRAMQRTYSREEYLEKIAMVRAAPREISITSDIIVGFPGETEADFDDTLTLLDAAQFDGIFAFQYSPRPNTPAATMPDAVPEAEKARRLQMLLERQRAIQTVRNQRLVGRTLEVLVEGISRHNSKSSPSHAPGEEEQWLGRTSGNRVLNFTSPASDLLGRYVSIVITAAGCNSLSGRQAV